MPPMRSASPGSVSDVVVDAGYVDLISTASAQPSREGAFAPIGLRHHGGRLVFPETESSSAFSVDLVNGSERDIRCPPSSGHH